MSCNHLHKIGGICCQKIIPLVFDQSYSYYEQLCAFLHKLNELVDAVNLQNTTIAEFENEIDTLFNEFKNEMRLAFADFQIEMRQEFEDFTTQIETEWNAYKTELNAEWQNEKQINTAFRSDLQSAWNTYRTELNASFEIFKSQETAARQTFETAITNQQNTFETTITQQQTTFETTVNNAIDEMQDEIDNINIGASVETVSPVTTVSDNTNTTQFTINNPATFINSGFANNYVRVYHCADISTPNRVFEFVKRVKFSELATDTDIPNVSGTFERNMIIFENSALPGIIANDSTAFGFEAERTTRESANINVFYQPKIPILGDNITPDNFEMETPEYDVFNFPTTIGTGYEQLSGDFHNVVLPCFMCVLLDNTKNNFRFTSSLSSINIPVNGSYSYDIIDNKIVRDPTVINFRDNVNAVAFGGGNELARNTDLHDLTPGRYFIGQSNAPTIANRPENLTFGFNVECSSIFDRSNNRLKLRLYYNSPSTIGTFYECYLSSSGWSAWYKFTGTAVT